MPKVSTELKTAVEKMEAFKNAAQELRDAFEAFKGKDEFAHAVICNEYPLGAPSFDELSAEINNWVFAVGEAVKAEEGKVILNPEQAPFVIGTNWMCECPSEHLEGELANVHAMNVDACAVCKCERP